MPGFDVKQIKRNDQVILGAGILFLLLSFFAPFYGYTGPGGSSLSSVGAGNNFGLLGVVLILAAVAVVAVRALAHASLPNLPVGPDVLVASLATLGVIVLALRGLTYPSGHDVGFAWGSYILFILAIVVIVFAVLNATAAGEKFAWNAAAKNVAPAGGTPYPQGAAPSYPPAGAAPSYPPVADYPPAAGSSDTPTV
jgi:hypothetical protein